MLSSCFMVSSFFMSSFFMLSSFFAFFLDFLSFFISSFFMLSSCFMLSCFMASPDCAKAESDTARRHIAINLLIILFMNFLLFTFELTPRNLVSCMGCEEPWKVTGSFRQIAPFRKVLQLKVNKTARIRPCRVTFFELVHLCNMVERCPKASSSESALFSIHAGPFRQRAFAGGRGPGGRFGRFRYFVESVQPAHLSRRS